MVGIDRRTGRLIQTPEHIAQSIEVILITPRGARVMRAEFGNSALDENGLVKAGLSPEEIQKMALADLSHWEPRATFSAASFGQSDNVPTYTIFYTENETGNTKTVTVQLGSQ